MYVAIRQKLQKVNDYELALQIDGYDNRRKKILNALIILSIIYLFRKWCLSIQGIAFHKYPI